MRIRKILALALLLSLSLGVLTSCGEKLGTGYCDYAKTRDVSERDVTYVEMCVENYGKVIILLDATTAPITVANFVRLVNEGFYNGLTFHRIIKDFMVQGGDPEANGQGGSDEDIVGEFFANGHYNDIRHYRGVISMAREGGNNDSASSQFFICNADSRSSLDGQYAAFGYVIMGMSVIDEITEDFFPKTAYADYYGDETYDPYYGVPRHYVWQYLGNGAIEKKKDQPVIKYIKVLENYEPSFDYGE